MEHKERRGGAQVPSDIRFKEIMANIEMNDVQPMFKYQIREKYKCGPDLARRIFAAMGWDEVNMKPKNRKQTARKAPAPTTGSNWLTSAW